MADVLLHGLTWDHRRAVDPLVATLPVFRECHPNIAIEWSSQPLHGFEFAPVDELAKDYDLTRVECWDDEAVNAQSGNCYRAIRNTMERAWIRPRYHGYLAFQAKGGELIEQHLRGNLDKKALLQELNSAFAASDRSG